MHGVLKRNKENSYENFLETLLQRYCKLRNRMSLKIHHLYFHLDFFRLSLNDVSKEHGEYFHQNIQVVKKYQERWDETMIEIIFKL